MNLAHLHLLLNHVPTVGSVIALTLLLLGFIRRNEPLKHAGLEVLFAIAVVTLPGVVAAPPRIGSCGTCRGLRRCDEDPPGRGALWILVDRVRRFPRVDRVVADGAAAQRRAGSSGLDGAARCGGRVMGRAGTLAARFGIPRCAPRAPRGRLGDPQRFVASRRDAWSVLQPVGWPAAEAVHFLGLSLSFGVLLAVNLRILAC